MKRFDYSVAINELKLGKDKTLNEINYDEIPTWVRGEDFFNLFLPYLKIVGDSREQDKWIETACAYYGIAFEWAIKDTKKGTENLKEGDYTFQMVFGNKVYDYTGVVAYERKGSIAEFYGNCTGYDKEKKTSDRDRIKREFDRFGDKHYKKVTLLLQFGEKLTDLIDMQFQFRGHNGNYTTKNTHYTMYSAVMSWRQPNNKDFDILQSGNKMKLFWLFVQDMYYYFRNEIRIECENKDLIKGD